MLVFIGILAYSFITSCSSVKTKPFPEYGGVDPKLEPFVVEYKKLAQDQGITFNKQVTIGFKRINEGSVIGTCTYGMGWREIDIDEGFFNSASKTTQRSLLMHELNHCYCDRPHDYGNGEKYPEHENVESKFVGVLHEEKGNGFYPDGDCPTSFMYPTVLNDYCAMAHYEELNKELFNRCKPY